MNLYDIDVHLQVLQEQYLNEDLTEDERNLVLIEIEDLLGKQEDKYQNITWLIANKQSEIDACKKEIDRLIDKMNTRKDLVDKLKEFLWDSLLSSWIEKLTVWSFNLSFRPSTSTEILDLNLIPKEYVKIETKINPDKKEIKKAIESWIEVPWAYLVNKKNLQIK